jgi:hypothetical protein
MKQIGFLLEERLEKSDATEVRAEEIAAALEIRGLSPTA